MVVNFAQFVEWPADAFATRDAPLIIAVVGNNPFGNMLERVANGKTFSGHPVIIRYYPMPGSIGDCHVLFVAADGDADIKNVLQKIGNKPVLTISQSDAFLYAGGVIRFYAEENRVRFEISPDAAEKARLKISSKLLKLASIFQK
jgi:preprotein translocase subunit Sec61beta